MNDVTQILSQIEQGEAGQDNAQIDQALDSLRDLGKALAGAAPEETKQLLASIVSKVVLHYDHEETEGGRVTSAFREGIIYLRPITGEGSLGEPNSTHLINNRPNCEISESQCTNDPECTGSTFDCGRSLL